MSNKQQRQQNANNWHRLMEKAGPLRTCPNCRVEHRGAGHFVPPGGGSDGYFFCKKVSP